MAKNDQWINQTTCVACASTAYGDGSITLASCMFSQDYAGEVQCHTTDNITEEVKTISNGNHHKTQCCLIPSAVLQ
jgi:hypothetical protein